jgi:hypothetical protein
LATILVCLAAPASAGEGDARTFFARGRELRLAGDCAHALVEFRRAYEAYPAGLGSLRNIAECEQQLGMSASARRSWWELRRAARHSGDAKYSGWAEHAEKEHASLEAVVPRLTVTVAGASADQVQVYVAAERLEAALLGTELERDPGGYRIEARARGRVLAVDQVALEPGSRERVRLEVTLPEPEPSPPPSTRPTAPTPAPPRDDLRVPGAILTSLGGAGLIGSAVALGLRQHALADLRRSCPEYANAPCPVANRDAVDDATQRGRTAALLVNVLAAGGGAVLAAGAALLIVDVASEPGEQARIQPLLGPGHIGVRLRF